MPPNTLEEMQERLRELEESQAKSRRDAREQREAREAAEQRAESAFQRAEVEKKRAESAIQRAESADQRAESADQRAESSDQRAVVAEQRIRRTTLSQYLQLCHQHLFLTISVQTNKSLTSTGGLNSPVGRIYPKYLRPWTSFLEEQRSTFERLELAYRSTDSPRVFENEVIIEGLGQRIRSRPLACEADLRHVQREGIEIPAALIFDHLVSITPVSREFRLGGRVMFDNHPHALMESPSEPVQRRGNPILRPSTPVPSGRGLGPLHTDQVCVYCDVNSDGDQGRLAFIIEDKPPHKLTSANLQMGLRSMDIRKDVIDRATRPTLAETEALFQYHSDRLVAAAITQIFAYMLEGGVRYGYITIGEAFLFLQIPSEDPTTILYHLAEPREDVSAQRLAFPSEDYSHRTALGQIVGFSLVALGSRNTGNEWRQNVLDCLSPWAIDYDALLQAVPMSCRTTPSTRPYRPRTYCLERRSPIQLRSMSRATCRSPTTPERDHVHSSSDGDPDPSDTPSRTTTRTSSQLQPPPGASTSKSVGASKSRASGSGRQQKSRQFCTHDCLRGLAHAGPLDSGCPNVSEHHGSHGCHPFDAAELVERLRQQLENNMDIDCSPMRMDGARGALFTVVLSSHGYKLVAKGTVRSFVPFIQHEAEVYTHLRALQGISVPVHLGNVHLSRPYYYTVGVRIMHMMFLSWAGQRIDRILPHADDAMNDPRWRSSIEEAMRAIQKCGIVHNDLRSPNVLWDEGLGRIIVIDFEQSEIIKQPLLPLQPSTSNLNKRASLYAGNQF